MSADRTSGVVDADADTARQEPAPDHTSSAKRPEADKPVNTQQAQDEDRPSGKTSDDEPKSNGETRSGTTETNTETSGGPESTEDDHKKPTAEGYNGPSESREAEFAARGESREYAAAYNAALKEKPEEGGADSVQSADKPATGKIEEQAGQGVAESPGTVESSGPPNATTHEPVDRAASDSGQPETAESDQDERSPETPRPTSDGEQSPLVDQAEDRASSDADLEEQPSTEFGSPLPGEEHIPATRAESRTLAAATNAELRSDEQDTGRSAEAIGHPSYDSMHGLGKAEDDAGIAAGTSEVSEQGEQDQVRPDAGDLTSHDDTRPTESETGEVEAPDQGLAWPDHAKRMEAKWVEHESRWPREGPPEGSPPDGEPPDEGIRGGSSPADRPGGEPGSWRGDGGQYLNHEENYAVGRVFDRGSDSEPKVTDALRRHEAEVDGAELVGLESRRWTSSYGETAPGGGVSGLGLKITI
jgi:hypothetical protein